jgi:Magnetochrome domain/PDZ domain
MDRPGGSNGLVRALPRGAGGLLLLVVGVATVVLSTRSAPDPAGAAGDVASPATAASATPGAAPNAMVPVALWPQAVPSAIDYPSVAGAAAAAATYLPAAGFQPVAGLGPPVMANPSAFTPPVPLRSQPKFRMIPFVEAHWQGLEMIVLTPALARALGIDGNFKGVIADDVTPPADACGFLGADIITAINGVPTPDLNTFIDASDLVREQRNVQVTVIRKGQTFPMVLWALKDRLGVANGETAPMIPSGSVSPHAYQGACTGCHRIGTKGQLPVDQGDLLSRAAPPIKPGSTRPHRDRGNCITCHQILP